MALPSREFLISEVDREFLLQHPGAPRQLDRNDPAQAHLVQQWNAMFHEFLNRMVDSHFYRFYPNAPRPLNPNDPGDATLIEFWNDIRGAIAENKTPRYNWSAEPATAPADAGTGAGTTTGTGAGPATTTSHPAQGPNSGDARHLDESQFIEYIHSLMEGAHYIGDSAEILGYIAQGFGAGEESALVVFGEALGPIGMIASTITVLWETAHSFGTGRRLQEQEGYCYGVMWQVAGLGNQQKSFYDWLDDSAEELREAFYDGVAAGREKAAMAAVHNRVVLATAYYQLHGNDLETARNLVLDDLWHHKRESESSRDYLTWPTPLGMGS